jgi:hypothetical protein
MGKHAAVELKVLDLGSGEDDKSPPTSGPSTQRNSISGDGFSTPTTDTEAEAGSSDDETPLDIIPASQKVLSRGRAIIVITQLISVQLFSSFCNGVIVVGLPSIASSLHMQGWREVLQMS